MSAASCRLEWFEYLEFFARLEAKPECVKHYAQDQSQKDGRDQKQKIYDPSDLVHFFLDDPLGARLPFGQRLLVKQAFFHSARGGVEFFRFGRFGHMVDSQILGQSKTIKSGRA